MHPIRIALYILIVLGLLLLVSVFSSSVNNDNTTTGIELPGMVLKYPTTAGFLNEKKQEVNLLADSIVHAIEAVLPTEEFIPSIPDFSKTDTNRLVYISWPDDRNAFIGRLNEYFNSGRCRILHYGDSQLEGDRISGYLRNRLQGIYGGSGPGFLPIKQVYHQLAAEIIATDNWLRYALFDPTQAKLPDMNYGVYASVSRFTPLMNAKDSAMMPGLPLESAGITIRPSAKSFNRLKQFNRIGLHYGNATTPVEIAIFVNGELLKESHLIADGAYHCFEIKTGTTPNEVHIELAGTVSPDFYGITLDGENGIQLDNIAMRGASGTIFSRMNASSFSSMAAKLDPKIVILQYGGNTVPYIKDSLGIINYTRYLSGHIHWLCKRMPESVFLFIGPGDMSCLTDGNYVTYPLLPYLDEQLKRSCLANKVAYWSMFEAMGGQNSMRYWVEQGLAASDYTHFLPKGSRIISEHFFNALYLDLNR
ncbi:SGNH/GDSL hydrolase family protein [Lentimicrobium sp.]